jgi:hypothetical protein
VQGLCKRPKTLSTISSDQVENLPHKPPFFLFDRRQEEFTSKTESFKMVDVRSIVSRNTIDRSVNMLTHGLFFPFNNFELRLNIERSHLENG